VPGITAKAVLRRGALLWFLMHPAPGLLERHARQGTAHAAWLATIRDLLAPSWHRR